MPDPIVPAKSSAWLMKPGSSLVWLLRATFFFLCIGIATNALVAYLNREANSLGVIAFAAILLFGLAVIVIDMTVKDKEITTISAIFFGLLIGFQISSLLATSLQPILEQYLSVWPGGFSASPLINLLITIVSCYTAVSLLLQTKDEFRFIIPYVEFSKQVKGAKPLVVDTSVIIDGRIADICETGIIDTKLLIPNFVLQELHGIADSSDKIKRNRGRRGLDVLKRMQGNGKIDLQMYDANLPELREVLKVDERLVVLAKALGARVVTNDFNLNKIAQIQGVDVINLNELGNALKLVALPGESLDIRIVKPGEQIGQGVGYLDDGTMVVVEQGRNYLGQDVLITVTSVLPTPAGRMIFGRVQSPPTPPPATVSTVNNA